MHAGLPLPSDMVRINASLSIGDDEISFTYSRSPGPGGQNVNKTASKTTLWFDVAGSPSLSADQRHRLCTALATRIGRDGMLRVVSWRHRTQQANRRDALARFADLLAEALRPRLRRKPTRPTRAARERRLSDKQHRSRLKEKRGRRFGPEND